MLTSTILCATNSASSWPHSAGTDSHAWLADGARPQRVGRGGLGGGDDLLCQCRCAASGDHGHGLAPVDLPVNGITLRQAVTDNAREFLQDAGVAVEER